VDQSNLLFDIRKAMSYIKKLKIFLLAIGIALLCLMLILLFIIGINLLLNIVPLIIKAIICGAIIFTLLWVLTKIIYERIK